MHETIFNWDRTVPQAVVQALRFPRRYQAVKCPSPLRTVFQPSVLKWQCGMNLSRLTAGQGFIRTHWVTFWRFNWRVPLLEGFHPSKLWKPGGRTVRLYTVLTKVLAEYASWQAHQVGISTSAVEQESEGELPFCISLLEWDAWFGDTDSTDSDISDNWTLLQYCLVTLFCISVK